MDIYLVTHLEKQKFHNLGSSVFLGGSIINKGGQNPLRQQELAQGFYMGLTRIILKIYTIC